jgi:hypothetical protein
MQLPFGRIRDRDCNRRSHCAGNRLNQNPPVRSTPLRIGLRYSGRVTSGLSRKPQSTSCNHPIDCVFGDENKHQGERVLDPDQLVQTAQENERFRLLITEGLESGRGRRYSKRVEAEIRSRISSRKPARMAPVPAAEIGALGEQAAPSAVSFG